MGLPTLSCLPVYSSLSKSRWDCYIPCRYWQAHTSPSALSLKRGWAQRTSMAWWLWRHCDWPYREGVSSWKPCPYRFGYSSGSLHFLCPDSNGGRDERPRIFQSACCQHHCLPVTQGSSQDTSGLQPKCHGSSNKVSRLWKCSLQHRPRPEASDSYQRLKNRFNRVPVPKLEKQVHLPLYSTHLGFHPILEKRSTTPPS